MFLCVVVFLKRFITKYKCITLLGSNMGAFHIEVAPWPFFWKLKSYYNDI